MRNGNGSDAFIITPKHRLTPNDGQNAVFIRLIFNTGNIGAVFYKPLQRGRCNTTPPCFYTMVRNPRNRMPNNLVKHPCFTMICTLVPRSDMCCLVSCFMVCWFVCCWVCFDYACGGTCCSILLLYGIVCAV